MAKPYTPVLVYRWETKHPDQPWKIAIDDPGRGPMITVKERYTRKSDAGRGAYRKIRRLKLRVVHGKVMRKVVFIEQAPPRRK